MLAKLKDTIHTVILPDEASTKSSRPTPLSRSAATRLASLYLQRSPLQSTQARSSFDLFARKDPKGDKPFSYIFAQYVLIDIRSTIPTLMTNLASPNYQHDSLRLAAGYDVISGFIGYLLSVMSSEEDNDETTQSQPQPQIETTLISPDLLLKLRRDLSETFSLTLEYLRDRWDAVTTGARGLDPSARVDPKAPPMLTWDNPTIPPEEDPILLAGLRAVSLWLREDENSELNAQAMGVLDVLVGLYEGSMKGKGVVDFRPPVLLLFEAVVGYEQEAAKVLLESGAWELLAADLRDAVEQMEGPERTGVSTSRHTIGDVAGVLQLLVKSDAAPQSREVWMDVVKMAAGMDSQSGREGDLEACDEIVRVYDLAVDVIEKAPKRLQKLVGGHAEKIGRNARELGERLKNRRDGHRGKALELQQSLEDIVAALSEVYG